MAVLRPLSANVAAGARFEFEPWLVAWLIEAGYAEHVDGTLIATPAGIEVGAQRLSGRLPVVECGTGERTRLATRQATRARPRRTERLSELDLGTTQRYIDLAGVLFHDEAEAAEARMFGTSTGSNGANG
jgi:hypothetical protein